MSLHPFSWNCSWWTFHHDYMLIAFWVHLYFFSLEIAFRFSLVSFSQSWKWSKSYQAWIRHKIKPIVANGGVLSSSQMHEVPSWFTSYEKDIDKLKQAKQRTTDMVRAGTLAQWEFGWLSMGKKWLWKDPKAASQPLSAYKEVVENVKVHGSRMRSNELKQEVQNGSQRNAFSQ